MKSFFLFTQLDKEERYANMHNFSFCITEDEPIFDAADITRCGKDIFVQLSMTCNRAGTPTTTSFNSPHCVPAIMNNGVVRLKHVK